MEKKIGLLIFPNIITEQWGYRTGGMIICCNLRNVPINPKFLEFFTYHPNLPLKNIFF